MIGTKQARLLRRIALVILAIVASDLSIALPQGSVGSISRATAPNRWSQLPP